MSKKKKGWTRQFIACEPRLSEVVELYKSLGFEVKLEDIKKNEEEKCMICYEPGKYKIIYTRPRKK
jgi:hypothetical protein